jgi:hypothetical protein
MHRLRAVFAHSCEDWCLFIEACGLILYAWGALNFLPFERIIASLSMNGHGTEPADKVYVRRVRWAVETAARYIPLKLTCLPQALTASWLLRARGFAPTLQYGVATVGTGFEAHAWVELEGLPVVGHRVAQRFTLLTSFPRETK